MNKKTTVLENILKQLKEVEIIIKNENINQLKKKHAKEKKDNCRH